MSTPEHEEHEDVEGEALESHHDSEADSHAEEEALVEQTEDGTQDSPEAESEHASAPNELEAEFIVEEVSASGDHRVARLQKMRNQFVDDEDLVLSSNSAAAIPEAPDLIMCPNCSSEEVRGLKFCTQCNARLPNLPVIEQKYNPGSIDGAARKYVDAVRKLQTNKWSVDEYIDFLNKGLERTSKLAETMADLSADNVISDWLPEAAELISDATQQWYRAIETMLIKVEDCHEDFDEEMAHYEELSDEEAEEQDPPVSLEDRVRSTDFSPEIESIFQANDKMLEYLRILDENTKNAAQLGGVSY